MKLTDKSRNELDAALDGFSIVRGGLMARIQEKSAILKKLGDNPPLLSLILVCITWIPTFLLSLIQGYHWGNSVTVPFLLEPANNIKMLLVIPLLILANNKVDGRVSRVVRQFVKNGMVNESNKVKFLKSLKRIDDIVESIWPELTIFVIIFINLSIRWVANDSFVTSWVFPYAEDENDLSWAGVYLAVISLPILQFLLLRWIWRWVLYARLMFLMAKCELRLYPTHPDKAGGLAYLGSPPLVFGSLSFILGLIFGGTLLNYSLYFGFKLEQEIPLLATFALLILILNVLPLIFFFPAMRKARKMAIYQYNSLEAEFTQEMEVNYLDKEERQSKYEIGDAEALFLMYENVDQMRAIPFNLKTMLASLLLTAIPILPVILIHVPLSDVISILTKLLL